MKRIFDTLRPPGEPGRGHLRLYLREATQRGNELWLFGETPVGEGYQSTAVLVHGFEYYVLFEAPLDYHTIQSLMPPHVTRWELVNLQRAIGFDYEQIDNCFQRRYVKVYCAYTDLWKIKRHFQVPIRDYRNVEHSITLLHTDITYSNLFLHKNNIRLQQCLELPRDRLKISQRHTTCQNEFIYQHPGLVTRDVDVYPMLCATVRLRILGETIVQPKLEDVADIVTLCSDIYWQGHDERVKLRFFRRYAPPSRDKQIRREIEGTRKEFADAETMVKTWIQVIRKLDVDVLITLQDYYDDVLHLALFDNLSRFLHYRFRARVGHKGFFYQLPGRSVVNLSEYLRKMQIKPRLEGFDLVSAVEHPQVYYGPHVECHSSPYASHMTPEEALYQCGLESELLFFVESGPKMVLRSALVSYECSPVSLAEVMNNGQQIRIMRLIEHYCLTHGWALNKEWLKKPCLVVPHQNSYPLPPSLPNIPLRDRGADYDEIWHQAVKRTALQAGTPVRQLPPEPTFPPTVARCTESKLPQRRVMKGLFGIVQKKTKLTKRDKYGGGYVIPPLPNYYNQDYEIVGVLDFASLYPNIIMAAWLCYSTLIYKDAEGALGDPRVQVQYVNNWRQDSVVFVKSIEQQPVRCILPLLVDRLVGNRKRIKKEMVPLKDDASQKRKYDTLDCNQLESKIIQNSVYGFVGVEGKSGKMPCQAISSSVTAIGRWMTQMAKWFGIRYWQACAIYGDTDSVMFQIPHVPLSSDPIELKQAFITQYERMAQQASQMYDLPHKFEFENLALNMDITPNKKVYIYEKVERATDHDRIKISGHGFEKRDRCEWVKTVCRQCIYLLRQQQDPLPYLHDQLLQLSHGRIDHSRLVVTCSVKAASEYKEENLLQLKLAQKIATRTGVYPQGRRLSYVVLAGSQLKSDRGETLDHVGTQTLDYNHYVEQLHKSLLKVFENHPRYDVRNLHRLWRSRINQYQLGSCSIRQQMHHINFDVEYDE
jgi:hypothetical protein